MSEEREMFAGYPASTKDFYTRIVYIMMLNVAAYRRGLFDTLLSDTEDIFSWWRFSEAMPALRDQLINKVGMAPPK